MYIWMIVIALSVCLDQISKYLTVLYLKPVDTVPLIEDVLHLTYVENRGAAFGMMADSRWIFMTISTVAIIAITYYLFRKKPASRLECTALSFFIGGGIGNMIDRVALGYVIDMIDFRLIDFAVFNVADSFVCVGAGLMILYLILEMVREHKAEKAGKVPVMADGTEVPAGDESAEPVESTETTKPTNPVEGDDPSAPAGENPEKGDRHA